MRKKNLTEILIVICVSYTILSLVNAGLHLAMGRDSIKAVNSIRMILWTSLGVGIMYTHQYFQRLSPLVMIIIQYAIAMGIIMASSYIEVLFAPIHPNGYRDAFLSFTIPYIIGASIHYIYVIREARRQNILLQEIRSKGRS